MYGVRVSRTPYLDRMYTADYRMQPYRWPAITFHGHPHSVPLPSPRWLHAARGTMRALRIFEADVKSQVYA
jgi:hypothetical protein